MRDFTSVFLLNCLFICLFLCCEIKQPPEHPGLAGQNVHQSYVDTYTWA